MDGNSDTIFKLLVIALVLKDTEGKSCQDIPGAEFSFVDQERSKCYYFNPVLMIYPEAVEWCHENNLRVLEIPTEEEEIWIDLQLTKHGKIVYQYWIALEYIGNKWIWVESGTAANGTGRWDRLDKNPAYAYVNKQNTNHRGWESINNSTDHKRSGICASNDWNDKGNQIFVTQISLTGQFVEVGELSPCSPLLSCISQCLSTDVCTNLAYSPSSHRCFVIREAIPSETMFVTSDPDVQYYSVERI